MKSEVKFFELKKGIKVHYVKKDKLPIFYANVLFNRGSIDEQDKRGIHNFTLRLLAEGPEGKSPVEISKELEKLGLRIKTRSGYSFTTFELDGLSDFFLDALIKLEELIRKPAFREEDFKRLKDQYFTAVKLGFQDPEFVSSYFSNMFYFKDVPPLSALPDFGFVRDVLSLTLEDVKNYYTSLYDNSNFSVVIVSDLEISEFKEKIENLNLPLGQRWSSRSIEVPEFKFDKVYIVNMDIEQAHLKIINPAVKRNDPIYGAIKVANFIWGGSDFSSRLMKRVRVKEGLSYSVNSVVNFGIPLNGDIIAPYSVISCETELNKARKAFDAILEEKTKVLRDGFEKEELEHAIQFFKGSIPLLVESYAQLLSMITEEIIYGLPYFHWEEELRAIEKLTIDEVNKGAQVLLSFESPFVLIVGRAKKLKNQFKDFDIEVIEPEKYL